MKMELGLLRAFGLCLQKQYGGKDSRTSRVMIPGRWQLWKDSSFHVRLLVASGKAVTILHTPPSQAASLRASRGPPRGEGGKQVLTAQPLLRCFPEIFTRGDTQSPRAPSGKAACGVGAPWGCFLLCIQVSPGQDQRELSQSRNHPERRSCLVPHLLPTRLRPNGCPARGCRSGPPFPGSHERGAWGKCLLLPCWFFFVLSRRARAAPSPPPPAALPGGGPWRGLPPGAVCGSGSAQTHTRLLGSTVARAPRTPLRALTTDLLYELPHAVRNEVSKLFISLENY